MPNDKPDKAALKGGLFNENGNKKMTGQQGVTPFILSKSGDIITKAGKQNKFKNINNFVLFLVIIFQNLNPIYRLR